MPLKVVHITTVHTAFDQRIFFRELISLSIAGHDVSLLVRHHDNNIIHSGVKIVSLGNPIQNKSRLRLVSRGYSILLSLIIALRIKADVYHLHDPELLIVLPLLKLLSRSKVIYDCHEDYIGFMHQKQYLPMALRKVMSLIMSMLEWVTSYFADAIITADSGVEKRFQKKGASTLTIYNFPRLDFFKLSSINEKIYDLVYHGSIPRYHMEACFAIDDALVKKGKDVMWLFIGSYGDRKWIDKQVNKKCINHRFILKDRIPHDSISNEVRKAKIGIIPLPDLPKFQYNIPTKFFEFMALEMPVVMSDLPPSRPFVNNSDCAILVHPDDYSAYADNIIKLLDNEELRNRMGQIGRSKVKSFYNWDTQAEKLIKFYMSLF